MQDAADLWLRARDLLLPYEGMASQLYVLDLPLSSFSLALERLSDSEASPQVIALEGNTGEPTPFSFDTQAKVLASSERSTNHILEGRWISGPPLRVWIWIDAEAKACDLEFVFWADLMFPSPEDNDACAAAFSELVAFAESFRALHPGSECVLSASEVGDPRDDRMQPWTLFW